MRFDIADFAAFDIHILDAPGRGRGLSRRDRATRPRGASRAMDDDAAGSSSPRNVTFGLPGSTESMTLDDVRAHLAEYGAISRRPAARALRRLPRGGDPDGRGGRHPHVLPPRRPAVLAARPAAHHVDRGRLPAILDAVDSPANGMTLCSGSLGARPDNDLPGDDASGSATGCTSCTCATSRARPGRIAGSFYEAEHLGGDTDMVALIAAVLAEERRRAAAGPRRRLDPDPPRPRPGHPRRPEAPGAAGLSDHRPAQGPRRTARHHDRARPSRVRADRLTFSPRARSAHAPPSAPTGAPWPRAAAAPRPRSGGSAGAASAARARRGSAPAASPAPPPGSAPGCGAARR